MSRSRKSKPAAQPFEAEIESLSHDGRGVAHVAGKAVFVEGGLPGEQVRCILLAQHKKYDEAVVETVLRPSSQRVEPKCAHAGICGGCSLQHLAATAQIEAKQQVLLDNLKHIGKVQPLQLLDPLRGPHWGYRTKARLGAKYVHKKKRVLVGFREKRAPFLADLRRCEILHPDIGGRLTELAELLQSLSGSDRIPQIEVAVGDNAAALVFRHLDPLSEPDKTQLRQYGERSGLHIYLQPAGPDSVQLFWPTRSELRYQVPAFGLSLGFEPTDFTQINRVINEAMINLAIELLAPDSNDRVLDLFCGLGNFTLPLATRCARVVGVEGDAGLVQRARDNAQRNALLNVEFHVANLAEDISIYPWLREDFSKILLDPPRSGAWEILPALRRLNSKRIVYISCNPSSLARDASRLVHEYGYKLLSAGVMDMFPHTTHVESIALFERPSPG